MYKKHITFSPISLLLTFETGTSKFTNLKTPSRSDAFTCEGLPSLKTRDNGFIDIVLILRNSNVEKTTKSYLSEVYMKVLQTTPNITNNE